MRFIGLDVRPDFWEIAISEGSKARSVGRVNSTPEALTTLGNSLAPQDKVILESTGNALEVARILEPFVSEVVIANPMHVRAIGHAKVKNDQFYARTLAELIPPGTPASSHPASLPAPPTSFQDTGQPVPDSPLAPISSAPRSFKPESQPRSSSCS